MRKFLSRRRFRRDLRGAHEDRRARMPFLQLASGLHHAQHGGEYREECGVCRPARLIEILDELSPLPIEATS